MDHLVVAERQDEILRIRIDEPEGDLVVMMLPVDGLAGEIGQRVVHEPHVPLEAETQSPLVHGVETFGQEVDSSAMVITPGCVP